MGALPDEFFRGEKKAVLHSVEACVGDLSMIRRKSVGTFLNRRKK